MGSERHLSRLRNRVLDVYQSVRVRLRTAYEAKTTAAQADPAAWLTGLSTLADTGELADVSAVTERNDWPAAHALTVARHLG